MKRFTILTIPLLVVLILVSFFGAVPPAFTQSQAISFAVIGDYGMDNSNEAAVANLVASWNPNFVLATGDDYYTPAGGSGTGKYDESTGAYYCAFLKDISTTGTRCPSGQASTNAFFPSMGNHDYSDATPAPATYLTYFNLPGTGFTNTSGNERYYDFVWGPVHFFALNSNSQEPDGTSSTSIQAQWLQTQLAASTAPWQVVFDHHPPYSSGASHGSTPGMQWPFAAWGADAVFSGHDHTYERILRDGIVYFVNGAGGASLYSFTTPVSGSIVRYNGNWGAQKVTADDSSITFEFYSVDGVLRDSYTLGIAPPTATPSPTPDNQVTTSFQNGVAPSAVYAGNTDATISQANPSTNYGASSTCLADGDDPAGSSNDLSCLLKWELSSVPPGSTITAATITLNVFNPSANTYPFYQLLRGWDENQVNWNQAASSIAWQSPGAQGATDRSATILGSLSASSAGSYQVILNAAGLAAVQSWIDNPANNHGLIFANSENSDGIDFDSSEAATPANRPKITITYTGGGTPPPTATNTATATNTPTPSNTPTATATFTPTAQPTSRPAMHLGALVGSGTLSGRKWTATVTVTVHDANHNPVPNAAVSGSWSQGAKGSGSCTTNSSGLCNIVKSSLAASTSKVTFTVSGITHSVYIYQAAANHSPTSIIVNKP